MKIFNSYLAFLSALRIHGLSEYQPFTIFVATKNRSEIVKILEQYEVKAVKFGKRYTGFEKKDKYIVSTVAKTFFDCFYHPEYAGGYSEVLKALYTCKEMNWKEFLSYFKKFGSNSLCQRVGYLLSLMDETDYRIPSEVIRYLKSRVKTKTRLDFKMRRGKFNREWLVIDNIGKRELLSWWLHG